MLNTIPNNNPSELKAFDEVCARLAGFDAALNFEWVDGFLTALNAGPQLPPQEEWLSALCGDAFERAFADPPAHAQALRALKARMSVLREQLDAELLDERQDELRLNPLMAEWTDADRARVVADGACTEEEARELQTGVEWAEGFIACTRHFDHLWPEPQDGDEIAPLYDALWAQIEALCLPPDSALMQAHLATYFPGQTPTRDDLVTEASYAVQDLRLWWVDHAPRPQTRRVEKLPGRNDPCHCGSGRKFKKCHGA